MYFPSLMVYSFRFFYFESLLFFNYFFCDYLYQFSFFPPSAPKLIQTDCIYLKVLFFSLDLTLLAS